MNLSEFEISIFGELEPISPTLSKARCRTFYKGLNRNGGYIDDQFADKLDYPEYASCVYPNFTLMDGRSIAISDGK